MTNVISIYSSVSENLICTAAIQQRVWDIMQESNRKTFTMEYIRLHTE